MISLLFCLACSTPESPQAPEPVASGVGDAVTEPATASEAVSKEVPTSPPAGSIGGAPILPDPVVLGAISAGEVDARIEGKMDAINRCYRDELAKNAGLAGKVLVRFTIAKDGTVSRAAIRSTSLRHAPTEECVSARLSEVRFPALEMGRLAIVTYPFVFSPT